MIYQGNGIYELSDGSSISIDQLKFILEEFVYDNNNQFELIRILNQIDMPCFSKTDIERKYEEGKEEGYDEGYSVGYDEGLNDGEYSMKKDILEALNNEGYKEAYIFISDNF